MGDILTSILLTIILFYAILNLSFFVVNGTIIELRLIIFLNFRRKFIKLLRSHWSIVKISFMTINGISSGKYEVYVEVVNSINNNWTNCFLVCDKHGNIFNYKDLEISLDFYDFGLNDKIKIISRDKKLKELGI